jgi:hypothetical protein
MKRSLALVGVFLWLPAALVAASVVLPAGDAIVHAVPGSISVLTAGASEPTSYPGLAYPGFGAVARDPALAAIFDPVEDRLALVTPVGFPRFVELRDSPTAAAFSGSTLFVVSREKGSLTKIASDGERSSVDCSGNPGFISISDGVVFTYDPVRGLIERFDPVSLQSNGTLVIDRFGSDFETDGRSGYLAIPGTGEVISFSLSSLDGRKAMRGGAVPVDVVVERSSGPLSAGTLAIADPASKRIWRVEGGQSGGAAFARGFLRGLIGLGLYAPRPSELPAGVDRIQSAPGGLLAFDSSSGDLYRITSKKSERIATGIEPSGYAWIGERVFYSSGGRLHSVSFAVEK